MPFSFGALASGLSRVLAARNRGEVTGEELRRQRTEQDAEHSRNAVHAMLEEQLLRGNLSHTATRQQQISDAAAKLRQNPRYKALWDLPDEELVQEAGRVAVERERPSYQNYGNVQAARRLGAVERQVDDTRADVARTQRQAPKRPPVFLSTDDSTRYLADSSANAGQVGKLQQRADSLGAVRDALAAAVEGRSIGPVSGTRKRRITADQRDYLQASGKWDPNLYEVIP